MHCCIEKSAFHGEGIRNVARFQSGIRVPLAMNFRAVKHISQFRPAYFFAANQWLNINNDSARYDKSRANPYEFASGMRPR